MIDDSQYLKETLKKINDQNELSIISIVYSYEKVDNNVIRPKRLVPILSTDDITFTLLKKWDITNESLNYFVQLTCKELLNLDVRQQPYILVNILFYVNLSISLVNIII